MKVGWMRFFGLRFCTRCQVQRPLVTLELMPRSQPNTLFYVCRDFEDCMERLAARNCEQLLLWGARWR